MMLLIRLLILLFFLYLVVRLVLRLVFGVFGIRRVFTSGTTAPRRSEAQHDPQKAEEAEYEVIDSHIRDDG